MLAFQALLVLTALCGLLAAVFWVRVASSGSLNAAFKLDGTEKLAERYNRRALTGAVVASAVTIMLGAIAFLVGYV